MLKTRLRKYEKPHDQHLHSDRLFEVRMHGLSSSKKRELEEILKQFVSSSRTSSIAQENSNLSTQNLAPKLISAKPSLSHTSTRVADSGYGSMAASNHPSSVTHSNLHPNRNAQFTRGIQASKERDQNIHSYLHDIPEGLLPHHTPVMTEAKRKQLVVSRLEQVFGGRGAAAEGHQHPMQQQEVSQLAAKDDRSAIEASGQRAGAEGTREAPIMGCETHKSIDSAPGLLKPDIHMNPGLFARDKYGEYGVSPKPYPYPEQRPTRPLDLDPHRAQIPAENMDYIRHLGFAVPDADAKGGRTDDDGWIYLNLLINMAQLHTINVTPEFVQQAVTECSSKFELSSDGRKIRWRGSYRDSPSWTGATGYSPEHSAEFDFAEQMNEATRKRGRSQGDHEYSSLGNSAFHPAKKQAISNSSSKRLTYTPMLAYSGVSDDGDAMMYDEQSQSSPPREDVTGSTSVLPSPSGRAATYDKPYDSGMVVFYKDAHFYTDLSGDHESPLRSSKDFGYEPATSHPIGQASNIFGEAKPTLDRLDTRALEKPIDIKHPDAEHPPSSMSETELKTYAPPPDERDGSLLPSSLPNFEVCGLGGVHPSDHFAFEVSRHISKQQNPPRRSWRRAPLTLGQSHKLEVTSTSEEIQSVRASRLEPSKLPNASFTFSPDVTDSDLESDSDEPPSPNRQHHSLSQQSTPNGAIVASDYPSAASPSSDEDDGPVSSMQSENVSQAPMSTMGHADSDNQSSVDFLAAARQVDPEDVAKREREYNAELAERLAEEIPAGSSAATCGGAMGSGFNSPAGIESSEGLSDGEMEECGSR